MNPKNNFRNAIIFAVGVLMWCKGQRDPSLPISLQSVVHIQRIKMAVPEGRSTSLSDVTFRYYGMNSTIPTSYRLKNVARLLGEQSFDLKKPTVVYAHGYVELTTDDSVVTVVRAYVARGSYNVLVLDWANLGFGSYFAVALDLKPIGLEVSKALSVLLQAGLSLDGLHFVGHSMGAHLLGFTARDLASRGFRVPRLSGLDPAFPGFYPPLLSAPMGPEDAGFVDVVHTDGGGYGAPAAGGHADFWPNGGTAKQPGCPPRSLPLSDEDFCSHWRSWQLWAEATAAPLPARRCLDYDAFLRGRCQDDQLATMGPDASVELRGNFYLRTAATSPFSLAERGTA